MIAIIDYGVGNLFSVSCSLQKIGAETVITSDKKIIKNADKILLPGVGAFADAAKKLRESGMGELVVEEAKKGKYVLGICLGMQLLFEKSHEYGLHDGLGLLKGEIVPMRGYVDDQLKVPHIGWNGLHFTKPHFLFNECKEGDCAYFVHSYFATNCEESLLAQTEYDKMITAAVGKDNVMGCQFHPEKSADVGLKMLKAFNEAK